LSMYGWFNFESFKFNTWYNYIKVNEVIDYMTTQAVSVS